jgi:hypothetical protein
MGVDESPNSSLFISYAHRDGSETAQRLRNDLLASGYKVWLDTARLKGGASWSTAIEQAVDGADVLLALLSAGSYASDVCRGEQLRALRLGRRVIPLLLQEDADRPVFLEATQFVSFAGRTPRVSAISARLWPPPVRQFWSNRFSTPTSPRPVCRSRSCRACRTWLRSANTC